MSLITDPLIQVELLTGVYNVAFFGVWTIDVTYTWNGPSTFTETFVINYVPPSDPCFMVIAPPLIIPD